MRLLLVEDDEADVRLLCDALHGREEGIEVVVSADLAAALARLQDEAFDVILLDLGLPDSSGLDTLRAVRAVVPRVALVICSGTDDVETSLKALRMGAQDYIVKGEFTPGSLARTVTHSVERALIQFGAKAPTAPGRMEVLQVHAPRSPGDTGRAVASWRRQGHDILYVAIDKPPGVVSEPWTEVSMEDVTWLDVGSPTDYAGGVPENVRFIAGARNPEQISMKAERFAGHAQAPVVIIDSLNHLAKEMSLRNVELFLQYMLTRMDALGSMVVPVIVDGPKAAALQDVVANARTVLA